MTAPASLSEHVDPLVAAARRAYAAVALRRSPPALPPVVRAYAYRSDTQRRFDLSPTFECFYAGGKGRGATHAALWKQLRWVHRPTFRVIFIRRDFPSLREILDRARQWFPRYGATWSEKDQRYLFPSGAAYEFGYGTTIKEIGRYQGRQPSRVVFDEAGQIADEEVVDVMAAEIRSEDPEIQTGMDLTANPGGVGEPWQMERYVRHCGEFGQRGAYAPADNPTMTREFFWSTLDDNAPLAATAYGNVLRSLPARLRDQLGRGLFGKGIGRALEELDERVHLVPARPVPAHWRCWGAFDWGYAHPAVFGWFAIDEHGTVFLVDSVHMHRRKPAEQAMRILEMPNIPHRALVAVAAGHDVFNKDEAKGHVGPTIAEAFAGQGIILNRAQIARVHGLTNLRNYVQTTVERPDGTVESVRTRFVVMDTPGNRLTFQCLQRMVVDPKDPEDALKVDANEAGEKGDDPYDMVRYGLMTRPMAARDPKLDEPKSAFDPEVMAAARKHLHTVRHHPLPGRGQRPTDPTFGDF